ncbi:hypothetical protein MPF_1701 [Methanohalophilus portucalensis FDF-1]|uniref:Uncharacterized protein n=1 Tax=Methanohalophilus portucalensis FDF-1 TaxID=523843 RepID=A0A1L9C321_9EURY|nr:hypothetical protein MPF_1701 [Methanohalophilus portucalensis FDF-1]
MPLVLQGNCHFHCFFNRTNVLELYIYIFEYVLQFIQLPQSVVIIFVNVSN